jgi:hypothetical protein
MREAPALRKVRWSLYDSRPPEERLFRAATGSFEFIPYDARARDAGLASGLAEPFREVIRQANGESVTHLFEL